MSSLFVWRSCRARSRASLAGATSLAIVSLALGSSACLVRGEAVAVEPVQPAPSVVYADEVDTAPVVNIETYPQTIYEGRTVYYYQDRWYFRNGARWTYYRQEPPALMEHRRHVVVVRPEERREEHREEPRREERGDEHREEHHEEHHEGHH
jgi:hypothetical protein